MRLQIKSIEINYRQQLLKMNMRTKPFHRYLLFQTLSDLARERILILAGRCAGLKDKR